MAKPAKWRWDIGNINATAAQTQTAYNAITAPSGTAPTRNFSVIVWNDIVDKIIEQRTYLGDTEWSAVAPATKGQTWMIPGERMTANIFNSAVVNMPPIHPWGWEATLGRKEILKGDVCFGDYFLYLVDGLNHWIDLTHLNIYPPNPFYIRTTMQNNTLVRRVAHIISSLHFYQSIITSPVVDPAIHIKSRLNVHLIPELTLPLYNTAHVGIVLILNSRFRETATVGNAAHVIINNPVTLTMQGGVTFGGVAFLIGTIDSTSSVITTINPLPSMPLQLEDLIELTGPFGEVSAVTPKVIITDIAGRFSGEAWVREPDSDAFKTDIRFTQSGAALVTQAVEDISTSIRLFDTSNITAKIVLIEKTTATGGQLTEAFSTTANIDLIPNNHLPISILLSDTSDLTSKVMLTANTIAASGRLTDQFDTTANITYKTATSLYVASTVNFETYLLTNVDFNSALFIDVKSHMVYRYSDAGTLTVDPADWTAGRMYAEFDGEVTTDYADVAWIHASMEVNYTLTVGFANGQFILASEIDDELVSDLDDTLVHDVEFYT